MTWIRVDAAFDTHPKAVRAGWWGCRTAELVWRLAKLHGHGGRLAAGFVDAAYLARISGGDADVAAGYERGLIDAVSAGLLARTEDGGVEVQSWAEFQADSGNASRQQRWRERLKETACNSVTLRNVNNANNDNGTGRDVTEQEKQRARPRPRVRDGIVDIPESLRTYAFRDAWTAWIAYRRELGKKLSTTTQQKQLTKLEGIGEARAIRAIQYSIERGWMGVFEPPETKHGNGHGNGRDDGTVRDDNGSTATQLRDGLRRTVKLGGTVEAGGDGQSSRGAEAAERTAGLGAGGPADGELDLAFDEPA